MSQIFFFAAALTSASPQPCQLTSQVWGCYYHLRLNLSKLKSVFPPKNRSFSFVAVGAVMVL